jgi:hypothetical protein
MRVEVELDEAAVAAEANELADEELETPESVRRWVEQNGATLGRLLASAAAAELSGAG